MRNLFSSFLFEIIGAFICWTIKGYKGKLSEEMSGPYEISSKSIRNVLVSVAVVLVVVYFLKL